MAIVVGNILQFTDFQTFLSQQLLNVYFYRVVEVGASVTYADVINVFQTVVRTPVKQVQHTGCIHTLQSVKNLSNGVDIFEEVDNTPGVVGGEAANSLLAYSYRLIRSEATTRHGSKRIGGLGESTMEGNNVTAAQLANVQGVADAFDAHLIVDAGGAFDFDFEPVIVGRIHIPSPNAGELDLDVINPIQDAQFIRITSQATRRTGRGS